MQPDPMLKIRIMMEKFLDNGQQQVLSDTTEMVEGMANISKVWGSAPT